MTTPLRQGIWPQGEVYTPNLSDVQKNGVGETLLSPDPVFFLWYALTASATDSVPAGIVWGSSRYDA